MKAVPDSINFPLIISLNGVLIISVFAWYPQTHTEESKSVAGGRTVGGKLGMEGRPCNFACS